MSHNNHYSSIYHTLNKNEEDIKKEISLQNDITNEKFLDANAIENEIKSAPLIDIFKTSAREQRSPTVNVSSFSGSYEQVSKHDMLSRYRERRTVKQVPGQATNASPSKDAEEIQEESIYEYVIEAPKSGLIFRDEILQPIFLPTKYEQNLVDPGTTTKEKESKTPSELFKEDDEMKTEDGADETSEVREFIYCRYPALLQTHQEQTQGASASTTESAPASSSAPSSSKPFWGLTFDSNFECGNLFSVESIVRKKAPLGSPEEYDLFLSCDPHYIVDEDDVKTLLAGNASIDAHSQHVYHQHYLTEQLKFQSNSLSNTWFFFKITNPKKRSYRFNIHYLSKSNRLIYGRNRFKPLMLSDYQYHNNRKGWQRIGEDITFKKCKQKRLQSFYAPTIVDETTIFGDPQEKKPLKNKKKKKKIPNYYTLSFTFHCEHVKDTIYFASHPLYTYTQLQHTIHSLLNKSYVQNHIQARKIGRTLAGNSCDLVVITENNSLMKEEFYSDKMHENKNEILDGKTPSHRNTFTSTNDSSSSSLTSNQQQQHHPLHISSQYSYTIKEILNPKSQISLLKGDQIDKHVNEVLRHKMNSFSLSSSDYDNTNTNTSMDEFLSNKNEKKNHFQEILVDGKPMPKYLQKLQLVIETNIEMEKRKKFEKFRKPAIIFFTRFHSDESNSNWIMEGIMKFLLSNNELAYKMRKSCVFYFFPMINVDAVVNGFNKFSLSGQNIQQCWENPSPLINPSIVRIKQVLSKIITSTNVLGFFHLKSSNYNPYEGILFHSKVMKDIETNEQNTAVSLMKRNTRLNSSITTTSSNHPHQTHHSIASVDEDEELEELEEKNTKTNATATTMTTDLNEINFQNLPPVGQLFTSVANRSALFCLKFCSVKDPIDKRYSIRSLISDEFKIPYSVAIHSHNYRGLYGRQYLRPFDYAKFGGELCLGLSDLLNETLNLDINPPGFGQQSFLHSQSKGGMSYDSFDEKKRRQKSMNASFSSPLRSSVNIGGGGGGGSNQPSFLSMGKSFTQNSRASIRQSRIGGTTGNYAEILQTLPSIDDDKPFQAATSPRYHHNSSPNRNLAPSLSSTQSTYAIGDMDLEDEASLTEEQLKERKEKLYRQNFSEDDKITLETTPTITNIQFNDKLWDEQDGYSSSDDEIREKEIIRQHEATANNPPITRQSMAMLRSSMIVPGTLLLTSYNANSSNPHRGTGLSGSIMMSRTSTTGRNTSTAKALSEIQAKFGRRLSTVTKEDLDDSDLDENDPNDENEDDDNNNNDEDEEEEEIDENEIQFNELFEDKDKYSLFNELNKKYELLWQKTLSKFLRRSDIIGLPKSSLAMTPSQALHDTERIYRLVSPLTMSTFEIIPVINSDKVFPALSLLDILAKKKLLKEKLKKIQQNNLQNMIITMKFDESMYLKTLSENPEELAKEIQAKLDANKPKKVIIPIMKDDESIHEDQISIASSSTAQITVDSRTDDKPTKSSPSPRNHGKTSPRLSKRNSPNHHSPSPHHHHHRSSPSNLRKSQILKSSSIEEGDEHKEIIDSSTETFKITSFKSNKQQSLSPQHHQQHHSPQHYSPEDHHQTMMSMDHEGLALQAVPFNSLRKSNQFQSPTSLKPTVTFGSFAKSRSHSNDEAANNMSDFLASRGLTLDKLRIHSLDSQQPPPQHDDEALEPTDHLFYDVTRSTPGRAPETAFTDFLGSEFDPNEELKDIPIIQEQLQHDEDGENDDDHLKQASIQGEVEGTTSPSKRLDPTLYEMIQRNMETVQSLMKDPSFMNLNEEEKLKLLSKKVPSYDAAYPTPQRQQEREQNQQRASSSSSNVNDGSLTKEEIYQAFVQEMGFNYQQIFGREGILTREMKRRQQQSQSQQSQRQTITSQGTYSHSLPFQKPLIMNNSTIVGKSTAPQYHLDYSSNLYLRYQLYHYYQYILQQLFERKIVDSDKVNYYAQAIFTSIQHKHNVFSPNKLTRNPSPINNKQQQRIKKKFQGSSQSSPFRSMTNPENSMFMEEQQHEVGGGGGGGSQEIWEKSTTTFNNQLRAPSTDSTIFEEKASILLQNTHSIKSSVNERLAKVHQIQRINAMKNQQYPAEIPTWLPDSYKRRILTTYQQESSSSQPLDSQPSWISGLHDKYGIPTATPGGSNVYSPNQSNSSAPPAYYFNLSTYSVSSVPADPVAVATGSSLEQADHPVPGHNDDEEPRPEAQEEEEESSRLGKEEGEGIDAVDDASKGTASYSRGFSRLTAESILSDGRFNDEDDDDTLPPPEANDGEDDNRKEEIDSAEIPAQEQQQQITSEGLPEDKIQENEQIEVTEAQQQHPLEEEKAALPPSDTSPSIVDGESEVRVLISQPTPLRSPELVNVDHSTHLRVVSPSVTLKKYAAPNKQITFPSIFPSNPNHSSFQAKNNHSPNKKGGGGGGGTKNHIPKNKEQNFVKIPKFTGRSGSSNEPTSSSSPTPMNNVNFFELQLQSPSAPPAAAGGGGLQNNQNNHSPSPPANLEDNRINRKSPPLLSILHSYPTQSKDFNFSSLHLDENDPSTTAITSPKNKQKSMKSNGLRASSPTNNKPAIPLKQSDSQTQLAARPPNDPKPSGVMRSPSLKVKQTVRIMTPKTEPEPADLVVAKLNLENDEISCDLSM